MQSVSTNVFFREDTITGTCQAIGDDFGFNPLWLRIAFALGFFFSPFVAIGVYLALGVVVLAARLISPNPRVKAAPAKAESTTEAAEEEKLPLPLVPLPLAA